MAKEEVYPKAGEKLVEYLQRMQIEDKEVVMCPRCSALFDKKATKYAQFLKG